MKKNLTFKQYQLISAYIDGRCTSAEKIRVETMLATSVELQTALAEFKRSKKMLAAVPKVKAPRNFTLSPSVVPHKPQRFFLAPALNYAALVCTVLFVFIFAGSRLLPSLNTKQSAESAAPMMAVASDASTQATAIPMITWGLGGAGGRGGGMGGGGADAVTANGMGGGAATGPLTAPQPTAAPMTAAKSGDTSNLILGLPSADAQGKEISPSGELVSLRQPADWTLIGEIGFAGLALLCVLAAWILRRRR